jgi:hypothetical protein
MSTAQPLPVSGAWRPGDEPGHRQFFTFATDRRFALDCGVALSDVTVAYETWGQLDADGANAILLCHAWTGDSHAAGPAGRGHLAAGWWDETVGPGKPIDTDRYFVVCANVLGGCQGSTGPAPEVRGQQIYHGRTDTGKGAFPSRMGYRHRLLLRAEKQEGHAVGVAGQEGDAGDVGGEPVGCGNRRFRQKAAAIEMRCIDPGNCVVMDLLAGNQRAEIKIEQPADALIVLQHLFPPVPDVKGEVKAAVGAGADAAPAGGDPVQQLAEGNKVFGLYNRRRMGMIARHAHRPRGV